MLEEVVKRNREKMIETIHGFGVSDEADILLDFLDTTDFYYAPASKIYHDNYPGGLFDHCTSVALNLFYLRDKMSKNWSAIDLVTIGYGHDLCKINSYKPVISVDNELTWDYNVTASTSRSNEHGVRSFEILSTVAPDLANPRVANAIVCHMGLWTKDIPNAADYILKAQTADDLVFFTHAADMMSSRMPSKTSKIVLINNGEDYKCVDS